MNARTSNARPVVPRRACTCTTPRLGAPRVLLDRAMAVLMIAFMAAASILSTPAAVASAADNGTAGTPLAVTPRFAGPPHGTAPPEHFEEVVSFAVGEASGMLGIAGGPEVEPWGPAAFAIDVEGRFHVIDGVNRRIVVADPSDGSRSIVEWDDPVACPVDIAVTAERTFVLDLPAQPAAVHEIDGTGRVLDTWEIPAAYLDHGVTGLDVDIDASGAPRIRLELAGAWHVPLTQASAIAPLRVPAVLEGDVVRVPAAGAAALALERAGQSRTFVVDKEWETGLHASVTALEGHRPVATMSLSSATGLGAVRFLDVDSQGAAYVFAEEFVDAAGAVRAYVKRYSPEGEPEASFELPVDRFATSPLQPVRIADDGAAYVLLPATDRVAIVRAAWSDDTTTALSAAETIVAAHGEDAGHTRVIDALAGAVRALLGAEPAIASWTPLNANDRAWTYVSHYWYCNSNNYRTRNGSIRPRYITSANRHYRAVPYCWGGFDTISSYNSAMSAGHSAGDINCTGNKRAGTAGVDCSGFVSRLWGLGTKHSTWGLTNVSRQISKSSMRLGDAYIRPGSHCMFFRYYTTGGAQLFESTKANSYDRVVTMNRTNAALANYGAYRYRNW